MPKKWIQDTTMPTTNSAPFIAWGSKFHAVKEVKLPFRLTQFAPSCKIQHSILLSETQSMPPSSPDIILGYDLICKLGLESNFKDNPPVIQWEDITVPMIPHCDWTLACIDEAFTAIMAPLSTLQHAKSNFDNKSPSMLATDYQAANIDNMLPTHPTQSQHCALACTQETFLHLLQEAQQAP